MHCRGIPIVFFRSVEYKRNYKQLLDEVFEISQKPNLIIVLLYIERNKTKKLVCASSLTARKTTRANFT